MKTNVKYLSLLAFCFILTNTLCLSQPSNYDIEYQNQKIGVFNPQWETSHVLNPRKYEHLTGYYREELAKTILQAVKNRQVKIYDQRKRELSLDSVEKKIILFETTRFNHPISKDTLWDYLVPFISAYDFEEAITYRFDNLTIEKKTISYCPYLVHYKSFDEQQIDTIEMPLFWIFPKDTIKDNKNKNKKPLNIEYISLHDTVLSVLQLKYPVKRPFTTRIFDFLQEKNSRVKRSDGLEFKTLKEVDDLLVLHSTSLIEIGDTQKDSLIDTYSDILPEDLTAIRIGESWQIRTDNLDIIKTVHFFLPLYLYDEKTYKQLGCRILCK